MKEASFPTTITRSTILGSVCWIFSLSFFIGQVIAQLAWKGPPSYSPISNPVSDLGVTVCGTVKIGGDLGYYCSPLYYAMNISFVVTGLAIWLGIFLTRNIWPKNRSMSAGLILLAFAGLGKVVVGLSPANVDFALHFLGSLGIPLGGVAMIVMGRGLRSHAARIDRFTGLLGIVAVVGFLAFLLGSHPEFGGLLERIGDYPMEIWAAVVGATILVRWKGALSPCIRGQHSRPSMRERP